MSENENIEARLCSYVEGDLDAEGRAEIEKYLIAHPQYRVLIEELSRSRGLLRGLPRESAPADLLETLSGQIERSALLGDNPAASLQIRPNRFPHLAAWAAVLLLSAGLAAVVYHVLPSNKTQPELALLKPAPPPVSATQPVADEAVRMLSEQDKSATGSPVAVAADAAPASPIAAPASATSSIAAAPVAAASETDQLETAAAASPALPPSPTSAPVAAAATAPTIALSNAVAVGRVVADGSTVTNTASQQPLVGSIVAANATQSGRNMIVTVHAIDASATDARVTQYLSSNGMQFESRAIDSGATVSSGPLSPLLPAAKDAPDNPMSAEDSILLPKSTSGSAKFIAGAANRLPATDEALTKKGATSQPSPSPVPMADALPQPSPGARRVGNVIIVRDLTADQAKRLASDLGVAALPAEVNVLPSTQPLALDRAGAPHDLPLQAGQSVRIVAREKLLPDVDAMNETQTVDVDGNITLPLIGKIQAAGLTGAQLAEKIPQAYHDAKSPTDATWVIDRMPATAPVAGDSLASTPAVPATAPFAALAPLAGTLASPLAAPLMAPLTAPLANSGEGSDHQVVNVTIEVLGQPFPSTAPAAASVAAATTQPTPPASVSAATLPTTAPTH